MKRLLVTSLAVLLAGCSVPDEPAEAATREDVAPLNSDGTVTPVEVSVSELVAAYDSNEVAAQQKYGGSWLLVTAEVEKIELDFSDDPVVSLSGDAIPSPTARFADEAKRDTASLKKGQKIVLLCGKVGEFMGSPGLDECYLQSDPPAAINS